jgi:hypothetical protein
MAKGFLITEEMLFGLVMRLVGAEAVEVEAVLSADEADSIAAEFARESLKSVDKLVSEDYMTGYREGIAHYLQRRGQR